MNRLAAVLLVLGAAAIIAVARGGHELPIYPSFYPHEIEIRSLAPEDAVQPLRDGMIQAYIGGGLGFSATPAGDIRPVESLGSFIVVRTHPGSARVQDDAAACGGVGAVVRAPSAPNEFVSHPLPGTPV